MKKLYSNQNGRSMIEMLGVLAIVGILSVGGIAGFSKAMMKLKLNKLADEYHLFLREFLMLGNEWKRLQNQVSPEVSINLASYMPSIGIIPHTWEVKNDYIYDSMGNRFRPFVYQNNQQLAFDVFLKSADNAYDNKELCFYFLQNIALHYHDAVLQVWVYKGKSGGNVLPVFRGDAYCRSTSQKCLREATPSDFLQVCSGCSEKDICVIAFHIPI
ncbi:MAG: type II secretion system GspH family protein [Acetobacter sp.]|nr:type II secretion system GspH family protein [Acetobacter sp.]